MGTLLFVLWSLLSAGLMSEGDALAFSQSNKVEENVFGSGLSEVFLQGAGEETLAANDVFRSGLSEVFLQGAGEETLAAIDVFRSGLSEVGVLVFSQRIEVETVDAIGVFGREISQGFMEATILLEDSSTTDSFENKLLDEIELAKGKSFLESATSNNFQNIGSEVDFNTPISFSSRDDSYQKSVVSSEIEAESTTFDPKLYGALESNRVKQVAASTMLDPKLYGALESNRVNQVAASTTLDPKPYSALESNRVNQVAKSTTLDPKPLRDVILEIQSAKGYRFLYRDAHVASVFVQLNDLTSWKTDLSDQLALAGLRLRIDEDRKQAVIYSLNETPQPAGQISGIVIDVKSGERLPYAGINLRHANEFHAFTQSGPDGRFRIRLPEHLETGEMQIQATYLGYSPMVVGVGVDDWVKEQRLRLQPSMLVSPGIVVTGSSLFSAGQNAGTETLLQLGRFGSVGESSAVRAVQALPAVTNGGSVQDGVFIRGSNDDAFQVLLDGNVVYNRTHLFGLIDSFNADVIRTSSLYYDVTPAQFQGPPGGTLNLITRTASLYDVRGSAGMSNTAVRGSLEIPLRKGRSALLISARRSVLDQVDVLGSGDMVAWGLDVDRAASVGQVSGQRVVEGRGFGATFYDLHGKVYVEQRRGVRWIFAGYSGFDNVSQAAGRLIRGELSQGMPTDGSGDSIFNLQLFARQHFETTNKWGSNSTSVQHIREMPGTGQLHITAGFSYYLTNFEKQDFSYQRPASPNDPPVVYIQPFRNASELNHGHLTTDFTPENHPTLQTGVAIHRYRTAYLEQSLNRPEFFRLTDAWLFESYIQDARRFGQILNADAGIRTQYFSNGGYFNLSPRLQLRFFPESRISGNFGFSRNLQYVHKLSFYNATTSDMWILSDESQPPTVANNLVFGVNAALWTDGSISLQRFFKQQENLRLHEINIQNIELPISGSPWYTNNTGESKGIEALFIQKLPRIVLSQGFTVQQSRLKNDDINDGEWFFASFDRKYQSKSMIVVKPTQSAEIGLSWYLASGVPDRLSEDASDRLGLYSRVDISLTYQHQFGDSQTILMKAGIYNVLDRNNPWYRENVFLVNDDAPWSRLVTTQAEVYDLGFQPSVSIQVNF